MKKQQTFKLVGTLNTEFVSEYKTRHDSLLNLNKYLILQIIQLKLQDLLHHVKLNIEHEHLIVDSIIFNIDFSTITHELSTISNFDEFKDYIAIVTNSIHLFSLKHFLKPSIKLTFVPIFRMPKYNNHIVMICPITAHK